MPARIQALADKLGLVPQNVKYKPPAINKNGFIEFDLDRKHLSSKIVLVKSDPAMGQWAADKDENIIFRFTHCD